MGTASEQSKSFNTSCPVTASFAIAFYRNERAWNYRRNANTHLLKVEGHEVLVVDHGLPGARCQWVMGDRAVRVETEEMVRRERRKRLGAWSGLRVGAEREASAVEQHLEEDLRVEGERRRVKRDRHLA